MTSVKTQAKDLQTGDVIVAERDGSEFTVSRIVRGMAGPYLILIDSSGKEVEHDTSFDSYSAMYTVKVNTP